MVHRSQPLFSHILVHDTVGDKYNPNLCSDINPHGVANKRAR